MTNKLDEFFNIESVPKGEEQSSQELVISTENLLGKDANTVVLELSNVEQHERDMDALATLGMTHLETIMDYANNVDERNVAHVLATAVQMHKNVIDAKESKARMRLQAANLLLRKKVIDDKAALKDASVIESSDLEEEKDTIEGDRNMILEVIKNQQKKDNEFKEER